LSEVATNFFNFYLSTTEEKNDLSDSLEGSEKTASHIFKKKSQATPVQ
jgi:hypothetical protein